MYHKSKSYKFFSVFNYIFLSLAALICLLPMINLLAMSFSSNAAITTGQVTFLPVDFTTDAYTEVMRNQNFIRSIWISIYRTLLGTVLSLSLITTAGYALSKEFKGRNLIMWFFIFTMLFSGGLIPSYILVSSLNLRDTIWALVLPGAFSAYNLILIMNFFKSIPISLEEAALIDGASFFTTFFKIYLPLSKAGLATVALFIMVANWNSWFDGILYMSTTENYPLASFIQTVVVQGNMQDMALDASAIERLNERALNAAQVFISTIPIIVVYPFLQKYFVTGIVMGAVKE